MNSRPIGRRRRHGLALSCVVLLACNRTPQAAEAVAVSEPAGGAITKWTDSTELFMEHPALIVGEAETFAVHLTDLTDFAPLRSGRITLRFVPRGGGEPVIVAQDAPRSPGIYGPAPVFSKPGVYDLTILVASPQARDSITVPDLTVYATTNDAPRAQGGGSDGIAFLKEQQWKTSGFATAFPVEGSMSATVSAPGTIEPAPGRRADVSAPISGLIDAGSVASSPAPGQRVRAGQVLAYLVPTLGEGGGATVAEARARLREAEDELARARRLVEAEAAPARRLHEAESRHQAAREALSGLAGGALTADGRFAVRSPINGAVTQRTIAPGSRVEAGASLFTILDASEVWLTVRVPAAQASLVRQSTGASFEVEGSTVSYQARRLVATGAVIDSMSRTIPLSFAVPNAAGQLVVGATARAHLRRAERVTGLLLPASAVLDEDGRSIVYVQPEGESFQRREVQLGPTEGGRVLVIGGLQSTDRVVTGAPYQVRLASLSSAAPAHGHEH